MFSGQDSGFTSTRSARIRSQRTACSTAGARMVPTIADTMRQMVIGGAARAYTSKRRPNHPAWHRGVCLSRCGRSY